MSLTGLNVLERVVSQEGSSVLFNRAVIKRTEDFASRRKGIRVPPVQQYSREVSREHVLSWLQSVAGSKKICLKGKRLTKICFVDCQYCQLGERGGYTAKAAVHQLNKQHRK